jgi:hypothetical protein
MGAGFDTERLARQRGESRGSRLAARPAIALAAPCLALATLLAPGAARADDDEGASDLSGVLSGASLAGGLGSFLPPLRLVGHVGSPGHAGHGPHGGFFVGVDTGIAVSIASGDDGMHDAFAFGVRGGYEFANGLALELRYDDLGVKPQLSASQLSGPPPGTSPLQFATFGVRYSMPFLFPLPFFEAMWGPAVYGGNVTLGGGLGLGCSFPIGSFVRIDVSARDWLTQIDDRVRQVLTFDAGLAVSFGSLGR